MPNTTHSLDEIESSLETALENAEAEETRYQIRNSLQRLEVLRETGTGRDIGR